MARFLLTTLAMLAFAANSVLNRMAVGAGMIDPVPFAVIRLAAGALVLAGLVGARRVIQGGPVWPGWAGRGAGVAGLLCYLFCFSVAYTALDAGFGALILFGFVQITMFCGAVIAGETVPLARWAGAGVAFGGLLVLVVPGIDLAAGFGGLSAVAGMVAAGIGWGIYSLAGRRASDALAATAANFVLALPVALILAAPLGFVWPAQTGGIWLALLSGAVCSGLGYALWYALVPQLGAGRAAVAQLTVPILAAGAGAALLGEAISLRFVMAAALVLAGVAVASLAKR